MKEPNLTAGWMRLGSGGSWARLGLSLRVESGGSGMVEWLIVVVSVWVKVDAVGFS